MISTTGFKSFYYGIVCLFFFLSPLTAAQSLAELIDTKKISVELIKIDNKNAMPFKKMALAIQVTSPIELSTDSTVVFKTFNKTVTIEPDSMELVRADENGFLYKQALAVYPLIAGDLLIPEIKVKLVTEITPTKKKKDQGKNKQDDIAYRFTNPLNVVVETPKILASDSFYVVSANLTVTDTLSPANQTVFSVGDSIERSIYLIAQDVPAMLLPKITVSDISGVKLYQQPAEISDVYKVREGVNQTHKELKVIYMLDNKGQFILPKLTFVWWDEVNNARKVIELTEHTITVGDALAKPELIDEPPSKLLVWFSTVSLQAILMILAALALLFYCTRLLFKYKNPLIKRFHQMNRTQEKTIERTYLMHLNNSAYRDAINCLLKVTYVNKLTDLKSSLKANITAHNALETLMILGYSTNQIDTSPLTKQQALQLFSAVIYKPRKKLLWQRFHFSLPLNKSLR